MARDRVCTWTGPVPTQEEMAQVLRAYFGTAASVAWIYDRHYVTFPSEPSDPATLRGRPTPQAMGVDVRELEVWACERSLYIMTRGADPYTSGIADALSAYLARWWKMEPE